MSASEFAFLALGLVLGVASGAALIEVLRARPPVSRAVRVTVSPNAIQSRMSSTLADPSAGREALGPAAGGPGDRRWRDELATTGEPATTGRRTQDPRRSIDGAVVDPRFGTPVRDRVAAGSFGHASPHASATHATAEAPSPAPAPTPAPDPTQEAGEARPQPLWLRAPAGSSTMVAVPMSFEPDPLTTALRASAAASAVAAMRHASATAIASERPIASERSGWAGAELSTVAPAGEAGGPPSAGAAARATADEADEAGLAGDRPCAEERRVAEERCALAVRARQGADTASETFRRTQRTHDEHAGRAEEAALAADPRAVRAAKEAAQREFHAARGSARTRDDVEAGARSWLADINRINHATRDAAVAAERDRAAAAALAAELERLAVEADAARMSAERADEACIAAREAVATCDEARNRHDAAAAARPRPEADDGRGPRGVAATTPEPGDEFATTMASRSGGDALILRILRGDREAMLSAAARLAGDDPETRRLWQARLGGLAEALIARSIEATSFDFPPDHAFWGLFNQSQNRDIAAALSSIGFRFDGFGGWLDERLPTQRDLAMAVGYAGLDPMRVRHWPTEPETRDLLRDVRVAADEYVAGAAGGLTLGELVTLLGRRADGLAELWNEWGTVRPILLEAG
ncbi:MAG TPA: hypothetical protein VM427_00210 [Patescibacteria group bacterium]|nr:hypothetical protein [Patescibacteria group bacterium]